MPQNIFKIYDGRTSFWQWDTKQKLIVLDDRITEVRFSHKETQSSKRRLVYMDDSGLRVCDVPDMFLQTSKNFIAYACAENEDGSVSTIGTTIFAVRKQSRPIDYTYEDNSVIDDILSKITKLESTLSIGVNNKTIVITDQTTDTKYKLYVDNGKLNMEVV